MKYSIQRQLFCQIKSRSLLYIAAYFKRFHYMWAKLCEEDPPSSPSYCVRCVPAHVGGPSNPPQNCMVVNPQQLTWSKEEVFGLVAIILSNEIKVSNIYCSILQTIFQPYRILLIKSVLFKEWLVWYRRPLTHSQVQSRESVHFDRFAVFNFLS